MVCSAQETADQSGEEGYCDEEHDGPQEEASATYDADADQRWCRTSCGRGPPVGIAGPVRILTRRSQRALMILAPVELPADFLHRVVRIDHDDASRSPDLTHINHLPSSDGGEDLLADYRRTATLRVRQRALEGAPQRPFVKLGE